jgi:malate synthase
MTTYTPRHRLQVADTLARFIDDEVLPGTGVQPATFWAGFDAIVHDLAPKNRALLAERDRLQLELDAWHRANPGPISDMPAYRAFLQRIGYLVTPAGPVQCQTANVDDELATLAGPQLVVPILNARYALNAANARWGSLYDALYGTDVIAESGGAEKGRGYNPVRGQKVIDYARGVLDQAAALATGSHRDATGYVVEADATQGITAGRLVVTLKDGTQTGLADPARFIGHQGDAAAPSTMACTWTSASTAPT